MGSAFSKARHTLLIPDLFPVHMELLADAIRVSGYRVQILRTKGPSVLETGLKYIHNDMCYPAICSVGQQLHAATSGDYDPDTIALLQFQTGGGCRASNYVMALNKALHKLGLDHIPVVTLGFNSLARGSGFRITLPLCLRALAAMTFGDLLMLLKNQVRPYERHPGDTQQVLDHWYQTLKGTLSASLCVPGKIRSTLRQIAADFAAIPTTAARKVKVGIVGEVYAQYSSFANNGLEEFLQSQDCEYRLPSVLGFLQYCLSGPAVDRTLYGGSSVRAAVSKLLLKLIRAYEADLEEALRPYPQFLAPSPFRQMQTYGKRVLDPGVKMGEGWYLSAEMIELAEHGYDNILCVQPFGCLPNHVAGRGTFRRFQALYPNANLCAVDYDANASQVNQENRIKLMLTVGRDRLRRQPQPV